MTRLILMLATISCALAATPVFAQPTFVYANDDSDPNTVSAFRVESSGALLPVPGSPFLTGGVGNRGGLFAANRATVSSGGNLLFVSNSVSSDITVFRINRLTGRLTKVPGSPFPLPVGGGRDGIALAATPTGGILVASASQSLVVFRVSLQGVLTHAATSPLLVPSRPDGLKVTSDGKLLAVSYVDLNGGAIGMYRIASNGMLTEVTGSPFGDRGDGGAAGLDVNCDNTRLYAGEANLFRSTVDLFALDKRGVLTPLPDSPFEAEGARNANVVLLNRTDTRLFVTNQDSNTVTAARVTPTGLTPVAGTPFSLRDESLQPGGMATDAEGKFLFVARYPSAISVLRIRSDGSLREVDGSPFAISGFGVLSIAVVPAKSCTAAVAVDIKPRRSDNVIDLSVGGEVRVALFSSRTFDATAVAPSSVRFVRARVARVEPDADLNGDGRLDAVFRFNVSQTTLATHMREACMTGATAPGRPFRGCDAVRVVR
jgi:6-phosphogluconolactonase (cycloisomerase 2 family)